MSGHNIAIIGAGIAGASLAAHLAPHARVLLIEGEAQPGYHATGRSAAFWQESYGGPGVQPLTSASRAFLENPPADFAQAGFLGPRGAIHLADAGGLAALEELAMDFAGRPPVLEPLDRAALAGRLPGLRAGYAAGLLEASTADIDVAALHQAYLRAARRDGAVLIVDAPLRAATRAGGRWRLDCGGRAVTADIVVNAAGAWADGVAAMLGARPLGIRPYRRTVVQIALADPLPPDMPLVMDAGGTFYLKALADGRLWLSPHDETACDPCDAAAEELDVALAIDRMERAFDWRIAGVERRWAGLRSFAPDRLPVYGFDAAVPGLFWCAGQGGFGIQTAPAAAALAAALLLGEGAGAIDPAPYAPGRFGR